MADGNADDTTLLKNDLEELYKVKHILSILPKNHTHKYLTKRN